MGRIPAPRTFPPPLTFGSSPQNAALSEAQPEAQVQGPGFANLFPFDSGTSPGTGSTAGAFGGGIFGDETDDEDLRGRTGQRPRRQLNHERVRG